MQLLSDTTTALIKALYSNDGYTFYHLDVPRVSAKLHAALCLLIHECVCCCGTYGVCVCGSIAMIGVPALL